MRLQLRLSKMLKMVMISIKLILLMNYFKRRHKNSGQAVVRTSIAKFPEWGQHNLLIDISIVIWYQI
jgi:hypothetical protein